MINFWLKPGHQLLIKWIIEKKCASEILLLSVSTRLTFSSMRVVHFVINYYLLRKITAANDTCLKRFDTFSHSTSSKHGSKSIWKYCWAAKRKGKWPSVSQTSTGCRWRHRPCQMPIVIFYSPQEKRTDEVGALCDFDEHLSPLYSINMVQNISLRTFPHSTRLLEKVYTSFRKKIINKKKYYFRYTYVDIISRCFPLFFSKTGFSKRRLRIRIRLCMYNIGVLSIGLQPTGVAQPPAR